MRFDIQVNSMRLAFEPVNNRRTFYGAITIGKRTFWVQRWDTARCQDNGNGKRIFAYSADALMCWTAGKRTI